MKNFVKNTEKIFLGVSVIYEIWGVLWETYREMFRKFYWNRVCNFHSKKILELLKTFLKKLMGILIREILEKSEKTLIKSAIFEKNVGKSSEIYANFGTVQKSIWRYVR